MRHEGGCLCGAVRFALEAPLRPVVICHCQECRKGSGHVWAATAVPLARFTLTEGAALVWYHASDAARRGHCGRCGSFLFWEPRGEGRISVAPGALDEDPGLAQEAEWYQEEAGDYLRAQGPSAAPATVAGGCLCGGCTFTIPGPVGPVAECGCAVCRKASGYLAASCAVVALDWQRRDSLAEWQGPDTALRGFCRVCGGKLFTRTADGQLRVAMGALAVATGGWIVARSGPAMCCTAT